MDGSQPHARQDRAIPCMSSASGLSPHNSDPTRHANRRVGQAVFVYCTPATSMCLIQSDPTHAIGAWVRQVYCVIQATSRPPRPAFGSLKPAHPTNSLKFPASERPGVSADIRGSRCMLWSGLKPDRQSGLKARRPARQIAGLKVPHPGNPYS